MTMLWEMISSSFVTIRPICPIFYLRDSLINMGAVSCQRVGAWNSMKKLAH